jgi:hypothetical protein
MVTRLEEVNLLIADEIDKSMFLGQSTRPGSRSQVFQGFRLTDPFEWIFQNGLDQIEDS